MPKDFYLAINGQAEGPFKEKDLRQRLAQGSLAPETLAAADGASSWEPIASLLGDKPIAAPGLRALRLVRDRLASKSPANRLGLKGDIHENNVRAATRRLQQQLERQLQDAKDEESQQVADEIRSLIEQAQQALIDPLERFVATRARSLGVDAAVDSNRSYLVTLYYQEEGSRALNAKQWAKSAELFDELLQIQPENVDGQWQHALALYHSNPIKTQDALQVLRKVVGEYPQRVEPLSALVDILLDLGRRDEAIALVKSGLEKSEQKAKVRAIAERIKAGAGPSGDKPEQPRPRGTAQARPSRDKRSRTEKPKKAKKATGADALIAAASATEGVKDQDGMGLVKVILACVVVFGWLGHSAINSPSRCFPAGEQEYFYDPGNFYQYAQPGGQTTGQCAPSMKPRPGKSFFNNLESELLCKDENPGLSGAELTRSCARIPYIDNSAQGSSAAGFFYVRRFGLLGIGLLLILLLGLGDGPLGRLQRVGFHPDPPGIFGAVVLGLILGFMAPTQFILNASLTGVLGLTALHVVGEELFFRGFVTRKLMDQFDAPMVVIVISALIFGCYHLTFASFYWMDPGRLPMAVGMLTVGAGLPYAWLYVKSESLIPPLICHLLVNSLMMWSSHSEVQGMLAG